MPNNWPRLSIAECAADEPYSTQIGPFGKALTPEEYVPTGVPLLRGVNVNHGRFHDEDFVFISEETADRLSKFESFVDDVLLVHKGTLGKIALMPRNRKYRRYIMGNSMLRVRCNRSKLLPEFLYYWLCSSEGQHYLFSRVSQVGVPQIQRPLTTLREATLPVPSLGEQERIANILGTLDDKIELNRRMNETLEAMARALFKSWFIDFDPVRAKAAGRKPAGLDAATAALFPSRLISDNKGEFPEGWSQRRIDNVAEINGWTLSKTDKLAAIDYIEISEVTRGDVRTVARYTRGAEPSRARRRLRHGDTVLSTVRPDRGAFFLCLNPSDSLIASTGFAVATPTLVPWSLVYCALTRPKFFEHLGHLADGGAYPAVSPEVVGACCIVLPADTEILDRFHKFTKPLLERAEHNRREADALAATRDALLPQLLSGALQM